MSFKGLFFTEEGDNKNKKSEETATSSNPVNKFPSTNVTTAPAKSDTATFTPPTTMPVVNPACEPHLNDILAMYEEGFEGLNQPGVDFYEFLQSVIGADTNAESPSAFNMAFGMIKNMGKDITKSTLITQADFYVSEIEKVYRIHKKYDNSIISERRPHWRHGQRGVRHRRRDHHGSGIRSIVWTDSTSGARDSACGYVAAGIPFGGFALLLGGEC